MHTLILGIESSCDDTAAAVVSSEGEILSNVVISQINEHLPYQGVVPEIASRAHMNYLDFAIKEALAQARIPLNEISLIAATGGPGLIGGVIVGTMYAKAMASVLSKPYIAVNHLEGHALTIRLTDKISYPYLLLLVSGGHCQFIIVQDVGKYILLGETLDDAVGEAFDKTAKMLGLGYPGGPIIELRAIKGNSTRFKLPLSMTDRAGCDMSFSGLKTAVRLLIAKYSYPYNEDFINDLSASFQETVVNILLNRLKNAIQMYEANLLVTRLNNETVQGIKQSAKQIVIAGGVAANKYLISKLREMSATQGYQLYAPPLSLCTDNAAMIAWAGFEKWKKGEVSPLDFCPRSRWAIAQME